MRTILSGIITTTVTALLTSWLIATPSYADTFGTGANTFTINFVNIGNPGDPGDYAPPFGDKHYTSGFGYVAYNYRMGVTEVPQELDRQGNKSGHD